MAHERHLTRWDYWILRVIAVYHLLKALLFFGLGFGLMHFVHHDIAQFLNDYVIEPLHFDSDSHYLKWILGKVELLTPHHLRIMGYVAFIYGAIFAVEGVGLYLRKRWAEYMVVIVVTSLLPFEVYEIHVHLAWWKLVLVAGNLLVVAFLIRQLVVGSAENKHK